MNAIDFATRKIVFDEASAITGKFDIRKYRFLEKPLLDLSNIRIKRMVWIKASSALGTVALQIAIAYRLDQCAGSIQCAMQSDEDASEWMKMRGKKWLKRIPSILSSMSSEKYSITNSLWQWPYKDFLLTGPGENAQQAKQVTYLFTDESHVDGFKEGALVSFEERMSKRWNRMAVHATTAADEGKEVDRFYYQGKQNEWHLRCPGCNNLVWPLWENDAKEKYNGEKVFLWIGDNSAVTFCCPFCDATYNDTARDRYSLHEHGDYVTMNPKAAIEDQSYRWNAFACHWLPWSGELAKYREAITAAKLGDLEPLENWEKKRLCKSYRPALPDFGEGQGINNYRIGDKWEVEDSALVLTADYQAGKRDEGSHFHALVTQWDRAGNSRRICYRKVLTFAHLDAIQAEFGIQARNVAVESGHDNRFIFRECGRRKWYCTRGSDDTQILQRKTIDGKVHLIPMPYSSPEPQSGVIGERQPDRLQKVRAGTLPPGWAYCIVLCNPTLYGYLSALISGSSGRYFGIASDFPIEYVSNMPAFIQVIEKDKKTNRDKVIWKKVREDHYWDCEVISLVMAARAGYFPFAGAYVIEQPQEKAA